MTQATHATFPVSLLRTVWNHSKSSNGAILDWWLLLHTAYERALDPEARPTPESLRVARNRRTAPEPAEFRRAEQTLSELESQQNPLRERIRIPLRLLEYILATRSAAVGSGLLYMLVRCARNLNVEIKLTKWTITKRIGCCTGTVKRIYRELRDIGLLKQPLSEPGPREEWDFDGAWLQLAIASEVEVYIPQTPPPLLFAKKSPTQAPDLNVVRTLGTRTNFPEPRKAPLDIGNRRFEELSDPGTLREIEVLVRSQGYLGDPVDAQGLYAICNSARRKKITRSPWGVVCAYVRDPKKFHISQQDEDAGQAMRKRAEASEVAQTVNVAHRALELAVGGLEKHLAEPNRQVVGSVRPGRGDPPPQPRRDKNLPRVPDPPQPMPRSDPPPPPEPLGPRERPQRRPPLGEAGAIQHLVSKLEQIPGLDLERRRDLYRQTWPRIRALSREKTIELVDIDECLEAVLPTTECEIP